MAGQRDDMDLMLYHDGELSPDGSAEMEGLSADDEIKLEALGQIRETVRSYLEIECDRAEPALERLWGQVQQRLGADGQHSAAEQARSVRSTVTDDNRGFWTVFKHWIDAHRGHFVTGAVTAGAVAVLFLALRPTRETIVERTVQVSAPVEATPVALGAPATVEYLDVVDGTGTVLTIAGEGDEDTTTVLWIEPDEDSVEGPI